MIHSEMLLLIVVVLFMLGSADAEITCLISIFLPDLGLGEEKGRGLDWA